MDSHMPQLIDAYDITHFDDSKIKALMRWRSRRGMKELDLLLERFVDSYYNQLNQEQKKIYTNFLDEEDQDLWRWCLNLEKPYNLAYEYILQLIQINSICEKQD
ncbi:succinate dehydrogenase assembly factor 2 family protein [bacterium]|nr:succinate dehydrogenase assembly factor 2 family protein [bacterium]NBW57665.1 succinate dehydrogenase assembly factor 2 family protein [bacterium]NBX71781.1 succinate dehydrogenase assembly factor 2 family protein [bacterium]